MPPPAILDPESLDFSKLIADRAEIEACNPQRYEFSLLDGVVVLDQERGKYAGFHDVRTDAFWIRGHIPGRPLFPGVLMIEAAAQLASYAFHKYFPHLQFIGFVGADGVKFRGGVTPPARFVIVGRAVQMKPRRMICESQGFVGSEMVFEGTITGMPM